MTTETIRVSRQWLELRERADAAARSRELVFLLAERLPASPLVIHDLGSGSGSMGRWLAPLLPVAQHWILHDRDADLLARAEEDQPNALGVTIETRLSDITRLDPDELVGASLVTASALLDLLTPDELDAVVAACGGAACPVLITLSVSGCVRLDPGDPLDGCVAASFDRHQRRETARGRLLGPDAAEAAADAFRRLGMEVCLRPAPWLLGADERELTAEWLAGWVGAACEHAPSLAVRADAYLRRRLHEAAVGRLTAAVDHIDLLVLP